MPTFGTLSSCAKLLRGRADEVGRLAFHAIVGDARDQRRHHEESARRHRARGIHQPRIVDPQPVHAVNNDDAGREADSARHVDMRRNRLASEVEGGVAHINRMHFIVGQPSRGLRIGNALQQRSRLQIVVGERIKKNDERWEATAEARRGSAPCAMDCGLARGRWSLGNARRLYQISRITGMINGRREVFFTMKRFRSWRIFSLIMP